MAKNETDAPCPLWYSSRLPTYFLVVATLALAALGFLGVRQFNSLSDANIETRIDRAGRAAASVVGFRFNGEVSHNEDGSPTAIVINRDLLTPSPVWNRTLDNIGNINQGAANVFRLSPRTQEFDRVATTFHTEDGRRVGGSQVQPGLIAAGHPAYESILASEVYIGEVPVADTTRLAYLTPLVNTDDAVIGILAVDIGLVDDIEAEAASQNSGLIVIGMILLAGVSLVAVLLMFWSFRPLARLGEIANSLGSNNGSDYDPRDFANRDDEIGYLAKGLGKVAELQSELEHRAFHDSLTEIPNRPALLAELEKRFAAFDDPSTESPPFALLIVDLDGFKNVNDGLGHQAGDELLIGVTAAMKDILHENEFLARLGGDEFAIISANDCDIAESAADLAQRIITASSTVFQTHAGEARVTASVGIVLAPRDASTSKEAIAHADLALYESKRTERGTYRVYEDSLSALFKRQVYLGPELRKALDQGALEIVYQPLYDTAGHMRSVEALTRWTHPVEGIISPSEFIPLAEGSGLVYELGEMVFETVGQQMTEWAKLNTDLPVVSINVSAIQLRHQDFVPYLHHLLERYPDLHGRLTIELTESVMVSSDSGWHRPVLDRLNQLGIGISIDDFGTGYSSLSYLHDLNVDQVKVDRSFVEAAALSAENRQLLGGIIALGKGLGLQVVVEGVETAEQMQILSAFGYDYLQGFALALPQSGGDVVATFGVPHSLLARTETEMVSSSFSE